MIDTRQLYILFILISVAGCSVFMGFPKSSWTTSSNVCSLPVIEQINATEILKSSNYWVNNDVEKAWTGTVIKFTKWAAFIGCGKSYSPTDSGISVNTAEDCLRHCSDNSFNNFFMIKSSRCYCLYTKPDLNGDINDCRTGCPNASYTPCSSGQSALVFTFVEGLNIESKKTYIENECLITTKNKSNYKVRDCTESYIFGCRNTSSELKTKSWYEYQEFCLEQGYSVLHNKNTIGNDAKAGTSFWSPIFRSHTVVKGKLTGKEFCLAVTNIESNNFIVENCTSQLPFLCTIDHKRNSVDIRKPNKTYPRFITLPLGVVVAGGIFIFLLMMIIIFLSCKLKKRREPFLNYSNEMKDGFPRASLPPNKVGLRDTYIDASDAPKRPGAGSYNDVYDDVHKGFIIKE